MNHVQVIDHDGVLVVSSRVVAQDFGKKHCFRSYSEH